MFAQSLDLLAEEAFAWAAKRARLVSQPTHVDPAAKWIIRSALQKAVRRGRADEAVPLALALHRIDARYAWRAVLTVAVEDVGFGSSDALLWSTAAQSLTFRRQAGELPLLAAVVSDLAGSPKTRSACELSFVVDVGEPAAFQLFGRMSTPDLFARVQDDDPYEAYVAVAVLRGFTPAGLKLRDPDPDGVRLVCELIHDVLPPRHARAAVACLLRPLDNMSVAIFPAFRMGHEAGDVDVVRDTLPEGRTIGGYSSAAYDQHERQGRRALRLFTDELRRRHGVIRDIPPPVVGRVVADAVFIEEGQLLDRWITSEALGRLRREADDFCLTRHGISQTGGLLVREVVRAELPRLNEHRARAVLERASASAGG